jgi:hypothetical protein
MEKQFLGFRRGDYFSFFRKPSTAEHDLFAPLGHNCPSRMLQRGCTQKLAGLSRREPGCDMEEKSLPGTGAR